MRAQKALLRLFAAGVTQAQTVRLSSNVAAPASNFLRFTDPVPRVHSYTPLLATVPTQARIAGGGGGRRGHICGHQHLRPEQAAVAHLHPLQGEEEEKEEEE